MRTEEIYHRAQEVWIYDQLEPDQERLYVGRRQPRERPGWVDKVAPAPVDEQEYEMKQREYLRSKGIDF
jgi:hypothetical protein